MRKGMLPFWERQHVPQTSRSYLQILQQIGYVHVKALVKFSRIYIQAGDDQTRF